MTRASILEYAAAVRGRYRRGSKKEKGVILTEFCLVTGYHRKSAIRLLNRVSRPFQRGRRGRPRQYGREVVEVLKIAWEATGGICSKRLAPFLPELLGNLERHGEIILDGQLRQQLGGISPATIDRLLKPFRPRPLRRPHADSRSVSLLQHKIAMRTFAELRGLPTGHLEVDLVLHCGMTTEGFYLTTLVGVDVATGWTQCVPVWGKGQSRVGGGIDQIRRQVPFRLLGIHSDNGSEFINHAMYDYCQTRTESVRHQILFTRSRPYKRNDQPRVEQKNGVLVRGLVGYGRYATRAAHEQLDKLYNLVCLHTNLFQPICKLVGRTRRGAKVVKQYDRARTPYQRLLAAGIPSEATRKTLEIMSLSLNPLRLRRQIDQELRKLWRLETVDPASELAARIRAEQGEP